MFTVFLVIQVVITLAMVGMILLQRSDADGLAGLGGGGGGANSFMTGRAAANFMTRGTAFLAVLFMLNSMWLAILSTESRNDLSLSEKLAIEQDNPLNDPLPEDAVDQSPVVDEPQLEGGVDGQAPANETPTVPTPE